MPVARHAPAHTLVCLRHGQSRWNLENRFTGWTDVNLTARGEDEARRAAALLTEGGYDFDACWTSLLTRAIRTLWITLETMDRCWLPVSRSWRLNERHYGALQGMNKAETTAEFGEDQVFAWRRGYAVRPPALEPGDERYPGHDRRYAELPRENLPLTESLTDTVARVLPLWETELAPAIRDGKRLLVAAHGNSLRALVKHLDGLSEDEITQLNIPTGMPLVYELDHALKPLRSFYLGDPDEVARAAKAVADQAKA